MDIIDESDKFTGLEYRGQYTSCKVFTDDIDPASVGQIYSMLNSPAFEGVQVRIMPDVHLGKGSVIGFTAPMGNGEKTKIIPNVIGVDIGCGVEGVRLTGLAGTTISFDRFDKHLRQSVPSGFNSRDKAYKDLDLLFRRHVADRVAWDLFHDQIEELAERVGENSSSTWRQCGSLGSGNHYIEIGRSNESKEVWLSVHSGSRHLGLAVAGYHQNIAVKNMGPRGGLAWLEGDEAQAYLRDMRLTQQYARLNRMVMLDVLTNFFDLELRKLEMVTSIHNYIGKDDYIRKGAVSAHENERVIIPWNMRDGSILGVGQGNSDWNFSAPHGAGRRLSRGEAKRSLDLDDFARSMKEAGVWTSCVGKETLDEAPAAYKPAKDVAGRIGPTVHITDWLRPIYNFKAGKDREGLLPSKDGDVPDNPKRLRAGKSKERDLEREKARQARGK